MTAKRSSKEYALYILFFLVNANPLVCVSNIFCSILIVSVDFVDQHQGIDVWVKIFNTFRNIFSANQWTGM